MLEILAALNVLDLCYAVVLVSLGARRCERTSVVCKNVKLFAFSVLEAPICELISVTR